MPSRARTIARSAPVVVVTLLLAGLAGAPPAAASPVRPSCGDDGCWTFVYQSVRLVKTVTGLGSAGVAEPVSFNGQVACDDWWEPDYYPASLDAGTSRSVTTVDVRQIQYWSTRCTITEQPPDASLTDRYVVTGPTTLTPSTFDLPSSENGSDPDHPVLTVVSSTPLRGATLRGRAWEDTDGRGTRDGDAAGIGGVEVRLTGRDRLAYPASAATRTRADGSYAFTGLSAGAYTVTFGALAERRRSPQHVGGAGTDSDGDLRTGTTQTVALRPGGTADTVDQGYVRTAGVRPPHVR